LDLDIRAINDMIIILRLNKAKKYMGQSRKQRGLFGFLEGTRKPIKLNGLCMFNFGAAVSGSS